MFRRVRSASNTVLLPVILLACHAVSASAQTHQATAVRAADLQVGGYYSYVIPGDSEQNFQGFGGYVTYDFKPNWGIEANIRQANAPNHTYERTYEIGGRYVLRLNRFNPYARVSYGRGVFNFSYDRANLAYNLFAVGGGVDYNLIPSVNLRVDYDYQHWMSFPSSGSSLVPQAFSVGAAYHFH